MAVSYEGKIIGNRRVSFFKNNLICVEIKLLIQLEDLHLAQALNYLEAFSLEVGLLINFGGKSLEVKRLFNKKYKLSNQDHQ